MTGSAKDLGEFLDMTAYRVGKLADRDIIPKPVDRQYDIKACVVAYCRHMRENVRRGGSEDLTAHRARLAKLKADEKELDLAQRSGDLLEADWIIAAVGRILERFRARTLSIPTKAAPLVFGAESINECKDQLEAMVHEALQELSLPSADELNQYAGRVRIRTKKKTGRPRGRPRKDGKPNTTTKSSDLPNQ